MKIRRNDPCHCGSNKKFKHCHQKTNIKQNNQFILLGVVGAIVFIFFITLPDGGNEQKINTSNTLSNSLSPVKAAKPSSPAPPGKVWSEAHGHYHDAPKSQSLSPKIVKTQNKNNPSVKTGIVPEGKVWDDKHGHYHDKEK